MFSIRSAPRSLFVVALASPTLIMAQTGPWIDQFISNDFDSAFALRVVDIDGDGDDDLVSVSRDDDLVSWFENLDGVGTSWVEKTIGTGLDTPFGVEAGDLDGDGDFDVVVASSFDDRVIWYENLAGDGASWSAVEISSTIDAPFAVDAVDVDGDGDQDVLAAELGGKQVVWFENSAGDGSAWTERIVTSGMINPSHVAAVDLDQDGDVDMISTSLSKVRFHENLNGDGSAWQDSDVGVILDGDHAICADLDGDGDPDVLACAINGNSMSWYENQNGDATSWAPRTIGANILDPLGVAAGDYDLDGDLDTVSAANSGGFELFVNADGFATAWARRTITESITQPTFAEFVDFDLDGDQDVATATNSEDRLSWHENRLGQGPFWARRTVKSTFDVDVEGVAAADIDGDGDMDGIGLIDSFTSTMEGAFWYENVDGTARVWNEQPIQTDVSAPRGLLVADVDGDSDPDAIVTSFDSDELIWFENRPGISGEWLRHGIGALGTAANAMTAGDVDRDGDLDFITDAFTDEVLWHANLDGIGTSWAPRTVSIDAGLVEDLVAADIDGDGDLDLAAVATDDDTVSWYQNLQGNGSSWNEVPVASTALTPWALDAGDLDGDGTIDLAVVSMGDDSVRTFANVGGTGTQWNETLVSSSVLRPNGLRIGDVDDDGANDLVTTSEEDDAVRFFQNAAGDASTWDERVASNDGRTPRVPFLADADGDGDIDIWIGSDDDANVTLFMQPLALKPLGPIAPGTMGLRAGSNQVTAGHPLELVLSGAGVPTATHAVVRLGDRGAHAVLPLHPRGHLLDERTLRIELPADPAFAGRRLTVQVTLLGPDGPSLESQRFELRLSPGG